MSTRLRHDLTGDVSHGGGGRIVFATTAGIFTADADGSRPEQVTYSFNWVDTQPAWSPDGSQIAFVSNRDDYNDWNIYVVNADGTGLQRLTHSLKHESEPAWSPDGKRLAYVSGYDATNGGVVNVGSCAGESRIYTMKSDGSDAKLLLATIGVTDPAWSPSGDRIAFTAKNDRNVYSITVLNLKDGKAESLTASGADESDPVWSPDGSQIAFTRGLYRDTTDCGIMVGGFAPREPHGPAIHTLNVDGSGETQLTASGFDREPAWAPDGKSLVFVSGPWDASRLCSIDLVTWAESDVTPSGVAAAWSPSWRGEK